MTLVLRRWRRAAQEVVAVALPPLLRPRRRVVRAAPVVAGLRRRLERLCRAGRVLLAVAVLPLLLVVRAAVLAVRAAVLVRVAPAVLAEYRPLGLRLWLPRVGEYQLEAPAGRAEHLRWLALALALHARARARQVGASRRQMQRRDLAARAMARSLEV
jgi:hypothetical protein